MSKIFCAFCRYSEISRKYRKFSYQDGSHEFLCNLCDTSEVK